MNAILTKSNQARYEAKKAEWLDIIGNADESDELEVGFASDIRSALEGEKTRGIIPMVLDEVDELLLMRMAERSGIVINISGSIRIWPGWPPLSIIDNSIMTVSDVLDSETSRIVE